MGDVEINVSGPIFDGRADAAAAEFAEAIKKDVAAQGYADVMHNLESSIRHPTPYYETQVTTTPRGAALVVNDRGIIYGPWLEGVGSRNKTTRFKGYFSFRRATQQLRGQVKSLADRLLKEKYLRRMQ
ncbi:MAG: hypothetical protein ACRDP6_42185 [Actinoallomurus sp.]